MDTNFNNLPLARRIKMLCDLVNSTLAAYLKQLESGTAPRGKNDLHDEIVFSEPVGADSWMTEARSGLIIHVNGRSFDGRLREADPRLPSELGGKLTVTVDDGQQGTVKLEKELLIPLEDGLLFNFPTDSETVTVKEVTEYSGIPPTEGTVETVSTVTAASPLVERLQLLFPNPQDFLALMILDREACVICGEPAALILTSEPLGSTAQENLALQLGFQLWGGLFHVLTKAEVKALTDAGLKIDLDRCPHSPYDVGELGEEGDPDIFLLEYDPEESDDSWVAAAQDHMEDM